MSTPVLELASIVDGYLERPQALRLCRARGSAGTLTAALLARRSPGPLFVVCPTSKRADAFAAALRAYAPEADVRILPRYDTPPFDRFSPHPEVEARRMSLLYRLLAGAEDRSLVVVAPLSAVMRRVPPRAELRERITHLERGLTVDRDALLEVLVAAGYHRTHLVEERGEVASRGGILDLFPPQLENPVRLEFDFDQIGSLRLFDPTSQRSVGELDAVVAIPPRPFRLPDDTDPLMQRAREMGRAAGIPESVIYNVTEALARGHLPPGIENLEPLFHEHMESVFDYLPDSARVVVDDPEALRQRGVTYMDEIAAGYTRARHQDRLVCSALEVYKTDDSAWEAIRAREPLLLDPIGALDRDSGERAVDVDGGDHRELRREISEQRGSGRALEPFARRLAEWRDAGRRVRLVCPTPSAAERLIDILRDYGHELAVPSGDGEARLRALSQWPEPGEIDVVVAPLAEGFELPHDALVVVTEQDVFGSRQQRRTVRSGSASDTRRGQAIDRLAQISEGDFLVHAEHGICEYGGLVQLTATGIAQEFLLLRFAKGDKLYIPVAQLRQVQGYTSADGSAPKLDRLGGQAWVKTKRRVRRAVRDMAEELLGVIAARKVLRGHAYPAPGPDYEEFEARFPFEDTPDQRKATLDVLADMQREQPMDRLVCGDVGFGKTEIACRAAYLATAAGKQVAFLVPTTVLCAQHHKTLCERFDDTAVNIASFSRMNGPRQVAEIREGLANGQIDIVVGTHRLLSKDVQFRDLGMVIVDEEHRFGVAHKERLKQLRKLVDVLTLSATPIPRTLQMAFSGMRDLSVITTPPPDRTSVRTQVCRFSEEVVREAVEREIRRGGQVFVVHNRVETIMEFGDVLQRILPEVRIAVGHGQMPAAKLEKTMLGFMNREYDVLLCTAIIESGLDIPNANTILIHRADHFGLAQLYQLRGRVGRSDRRAYCYLFAPPEGRMTNDARRRIEAIQELSELGAGFRLATEDLEIRGAGNLLGAEQSGQIASVGYDLYMEMLEEAIARLQGEDLEPQFDPEIRLPVPALLPDDYVSDVSQRLVLYKQLSAARDEDEVAAVRDDLLDRFGSLPVAAENLIGVMRLKLLCRPLGIEAIDTNGNLLSLRIRSDARIDAHGLADLLARPGSPLRVRPDHRIEIDLREPNDALAEAFGLVELLTPAAKTDEIKDDRSPRRPAG